MNAVPDRGRTRGLSRLFAKSARDVDAGAYLQDFLVTAIAAILLTRFFLVVSGYPQIGGGGLHLAHLLWGGLLMLAAMVLLLTFIGKHTKRLAALLGGAGFGLFIDEIGKFVTADNDYFFQPAIALIYTILIGLFLIFRSIGRRSLTSEELLANAVGMVREMVIGGATESEAIRARYLLERSAATGAVADGLLDAIDGAVREPDMEPSWIARMAGHAWRFYDRMLSWHWFRQAVLAVFIGQSIIGGFALLALTFGFFAAVALPAARVFPGLPIVFDTPSGVGGDALGVAGLAAGIGSSMLSLGLAILGVWRLRTSRLASYRWLERSVLVSVFFVQITLFWLDQFSATGELAWNLVLLGALRYAIRQEEARQRQVTISHRA